MKYLLTITLLISSLLTGCVSPERTAYRTIATVSAAVDSSMKTWATFVVSGRATPEQEAGVKKAYQDYQLAMAVVENSVRATLMTDKTSNYDKALDALDTSKNSLVKLVFQFVK